MLDPQQIADGTQYVLTLSRQPADAKAATRGAQVFASNCVACHGAEGKGDQTQGTPNLTDQEWIYGGTAQEITTQINLCRGGVMPTMSQRLDPETLDALAVYVHSLGGGT
ncbi:MAG: c-type cytochrome [Hyphomonadaceae bacterium]